MIKTRREIEMQNVDNDLTREKRLKKRFAESIPVKHSNIIFLFYIFFFSFSLFLFSSFFFVFPFLFIFHFFFFFFFFADSFFFLLKLQ